MNGEHNEIDGVDNTVKGQEHALDIVNISLEEEVKTAYIDYAMNVITSRAIPDIRDGLKPVQRRIIYAMEVIGNHHDKPFKKSSRIIGEVIGKYHPHGNDPVYDAIARMAQDFTCNYPLLEGQGNFGSIDGDEPAKMRYTGIRISKLGEYMVTDLDKDTVPFSLNYDDTELMPDVLPCQIPNLLINGASGIAVGMATNIPPHNLGEIIDALILLVRNPEAEITELMTIVKGPAFPTGGLICGTRGITEAYSTGRGTLVLRGKTHLEKHAIVITELPYQINKAVLIEDLAAQVNQKKIQGISDISDESDKKGIRIVIHLKKEALPEIVLNNLFKATKLQDYFHVNFVAIDQDGSPKTFKLKEALQAFIDYRMTIITRRTLFDLNKAKARLSILQGFAVALANIEAIVTHLRLIKSHKEAQHYLRYTPFTLATVDAIFLELSQESHPPEDAEIVANGYYFTPKQIETVLDLRLTNLTGLESEKIKSEALRLLDQVHHYNQILTDRKIFLETLIQELEFVKTQDTSPRLTIIGAEAVSIHDEDLIAPDKMLISLSQSGYIKAQVLSQYDAKNRGAVGLFLAKLKEEDNIKEVHVALRTTTLLCFSNRGKVFWLKTYLIPEMERNAKGKPINNLLPLDEGEGIATLLPLEVNPENHYLLFTTQRGQTKRTPLAMFAKPRTHGLKFMTIKEGDALAHVKLTTGQDDVMLFSSAGKVCRFKEDAIRAMGRQAAGVRGMLLGKTERVVSVLTLDPQLPDLAIVTVTQNGYGKRSKVTAYKTTNRGVKGIKAMTTSKRNGAIVAAVVAAPEDDILIVTDSGFVTRINVSKINIIGRVTQGFKLMAMRNNSQVTTVELIKQSSYSEK